MSNFTLKKKHLVIKGGKIAGVILPVVGEVKVNTDESKLGKGGLTTSCDFLEFEGKDPTIDFQIGWLSVISICGTALIVLHDMGYDLNDKKSIKKATKNVDGVFEHYEKLIKQKPELFGEKWAKEAEKKEKEKEEKKEKKEKKKKDRETKKKQKIENAAKEEKKVINFLNKIGTPAAGYDFLEGGGLLMHTNLMIRSNQMFGYNISDDDYNSSWVKHSSLYEGLEEKLPLEETFGWSRNAAQEILSPSSCIFVEGKDPPIDVIKSINEGDAYKLLLSLVEKGELIPKKKYEKKLKKEHYPFGDTTFSKSAIKEIEEDGPLGFSPFVTKEYYKNMKSGEDAISKEQLGFINAVVELLTEKSIKMTISDIAAHIKSGDRDEVKRRLELLYKAGVIDFAGSGRYFIYSEKKKKTKSEKTKSEKTSDKPVDLKAELKKYKALLDEGLIDKDDYEKKKDSLLGL